jgi:DNA-binding response OmpR family regulator
LLAHVWGAGFDGYEHTVNSHINRLRAKIDADATRPRLIETVWGLGYQFNAPAVLP